MTFTTRRRIEFCDTDAAGIAHFSVFFPMMESAEHELLRSLGISVISPHPESPQAEPTWPRVSSACDFFLAVRFEDVLTIHVDISRIGNTSVQYRFRFTRDDDLIAKGTITSVCCLLSPQGLRKVAIPDSIRSRLNPHLALADEG